MTVFVTDVEDEEDEELGILVVGYMRELVVPRRIRGKMSPAGAPTFFHIIIRVAHVQCTLYYMYYILLWNVV